MAYLRASEVTTNDGKAILSSMWVGFDGKFITYVDPQKPLDATSEDTRELGESVTPIPGLMNIHDHTSHKPLCLPAPSKAFGECATKLMNNDLFYLILYSHASMLSYLKDEGITYVRDQGLTSYTYINLRQVIEEGFVMGPYISSHGVPISVAGGHCYRQSIECDGPNAVRCAVHIQCNKNADVIKFMGSSGLEHFPQEDPSIPQFTLEELRAGTDAAHDLGRDCAIHTYSNEEIRRAVLVGIDHIEHGCTMTEDLIEGMAKRGTHLNPTMTGTHGAVKAGPNAKYRDAPQKRMFSKQEQSTCWTKAASILIGVGTDTVGILRDRIVMIADTFGEGPVEATGHTANTSARVAKCDGMELLGARRSVDIVISDGDLTRSLDGLTRVVQTWKDGTIRKQ